MIRGQQTTLGALADGARFYFLHHKAQVWEREQEVQASALVDPEIKCMMGHIHKNFKPDKQVVYLRTNK